MTTPHISPQVEKHIRNHRRYFHRNPELGFEEIETQKYLISQLTTLGLDPQPMSKTGLVAVLEGEAGIGPCIALRADMDALPIQEANELLSYSSKTPGIMHACGHDGHMAILLGVVEELVRRKSELRGTIKFIFQPGEEGFAGAKMMVTDGVLENPHVDAIFGAHLWTYQPVGTIGVKSGPTMAAADEFEINVVGKGGHGAMPQGTVDAISVSAHLVQAIQSIVSRNIDPIDSAVITVGTFNAGSNFNVIAEQAHLTGTVRAYKEKVRQLLKNRLSEICEGTGRSFGAKIHMNYKDGYPPVINDTAATDKLRIAAGKIVGSENVIPPYLTMGGEDMAYYLNERPGCFFFIGAGNHQAQSQSEIIPHHSPRFKFDEKALTIGAAVIVQLIEDYLK